MKNKKIQFLSQSAMIAAVYVVLVLIFRQLSFSGIQFRIAEALTVLPYFTPAAIPGLLFGCLLANILGGAVLIDVVFGTLATGLAAFTSYLLRRYKWLVPVPPILFNTVTIPFVIKFAYMDAAPIPLLAMSVFIGQFVTCGILGMFLLFSLERYNFSFFKQ